MSGHDDSEFDRLAGQPTEPGAHTHELLASAVTDRSMDLGEIADLGRMDVTPPRSSPLPWMVAVGAGLVAVILLFAFVVPGQSELREAQDALDRANQEVVRLQELVQQLETERSELEEVRAQLVAEAEETALEIDALRRAAEARDAQDKREAAAAVVKPPAKKKRKRKRK